VRPVPTNNTEGDTMEGPTKPAGGRGSTFRGEPAVVPSETPRSGPRRLVELSHQIHHGMVTYPGLPGPEISDYLPREASAARYGPGTAFHIGRISMVANTGTYLDSPFHRFAGATDVAGLPLQCVADLDGVVVRIEAGLRAIDRDAFDSHEVEGRAVLVHTGWDRHWTTERYGTDNPFLTAAAADWLVEQQAGLVGIDSVNIDDTSGQARPVHTALLAAGIPIVEHLCGLDQLPASGFRFHAAPPRVVGIGTFPVRAYAVVADG
jgi:arylformamidase